MFLPGERGGSRVISGTPGQGCPVVGAHVGVWDLDDVPEEIVGQALDLLRRSGLAYHYSTTWGHGQTASSLKADKRPKACFRCKVEGRVKPAQGVITTWSCEACNQSWGTIRARVVIPFSRMVTPGDEWLTVWRYVDRHIFSGASDPSSDQIDRKYFMPTCREGGSAPPQWDVRDGAPLPVEKLLLSPRPLAGDPAEQAGADAGTPLSRQQLWDLSDSLRAKSKSEKIKEIGTAIRALLDGREWAPSGHRHSMMVKIVYVIVEGYPRVRPSAVSAHFAPSLQGMQTKTTPEEIESIVRKRQEAARAEDAKRIAEALGGGRMAYYSPEEIEAMANAIGASPNEMERRWIIQCGGSFYVLCAGRYWRYSRESVMSAIYRDLSPHSGISLKTEGQKARNKTLEELMRDYGAVAVGVVVDLTAQRAYYDPEKRIMYEAPCPIRVSAEYSLEVEEWLRLLAGPLAERLNQWLACLTRLEEPCVALCLEGAPDTGKSLFMKGVSRVYGTRPAELEGALAGFNEEIILNPVVVADEHLPEDARGQVRTEAIRKFVQERERALNRKYQPPATVFGASRVIIAANNNDKLIHTTDNLNNYDIAAITERFLVIPVQDASRQYLQNDRAMIRRWMENDTIAKHTVWLCENFDVVPHGRFLVKGEAKAMTNALSTGSGLRAGVCQWITGLLQRPDLIIGRGFAKPELLQIVNEKLLLTSKIIHEAWNEHISEKSAPPPPSKISRALSGLSDEVCLRVNGKPTKMRAVNLDQIASWASDHGYGEVELGPLAEGLRKMPKRPVVVPPSTAN